MIFKRSTPFYKFIKVLEKTHACSDAIYWAKWVDSRVEDCTFGRGIDELPEPNWAKYCIDTYSKWFDEDVLLGFKLAAKGINHGNLHKKVFV